MARYIPSPDLPKASDTKREKRKKQLMHIIHRYPGKRRERAIAEFRRDYDASIKFFFGKRAEERVNGS